MIKEYSITNFKAFGETATIPIKPLTLIFGPNSSGKSSIFQSMLMLKQTLESSMSPKPSLLPKGDLVDLGSYKEFVHNHAVDKNNPFRISVQTELHGAFQALVARYYPPDNFEIDYDDDESGHDFFLKNLYDKIEENIHSNRTGIRITFSLDKHDRPLVSDVELYLGDETEPLITYKGREQAYKERAVFFERVKQETFPHNDQFMLDIFRYIICSVSAINIGHEYFGR
jgi:AAA15 family ATPase/GTPase